MAGRRAWLCVVAAAVLGPAAAGCSGGAQFQEHFDQGQNYLQRGQHRQAVAEFEQALQLQPESVDTRLRLGDAYVGAKQFDEALETTMGIFQVADAADLSGRVKAVAYRRVAVINLRAAWPTKDTAGLQRASTYFDKWREVENNYAAHLGKGLALIGLKRYFRAAGGRDNAWKRLAEGIGVNARRCEASYFRAIAGDRSGQVPAAEVAELYRAALKKAEFTNATGGSGGPFPEIPDFDINYVNASLIGLLDLLRRSPSAASSDEASAKKEGEALLQKLLDGGGTVPQAVKAWLGQTGGGTTGNGGTGTTPPAAQQPPEIVTAPWAADRIEPAGLPFKFTLLAQGEAEPTQLEVRLNEKLLAADVKSKKLPVADVDGSTVFRTEFTVVLQLEPGTHALQIRALDARGGRTLVPWEATVHGRTPQKTLLVVGRGGASAPGAEADATAVASTLGDRLDVAAARRKLLTAESATPDAVLGAIADLTKGGAPTDSLWIYIAAPGGKDGGGSPALALAGGENAPAWLSLARLARTLRASGVGRVWVCLDSGFAGTGGRREGEAATPDADGFAKAMTVDGTRRSVLFGAMNGTAAERPGEEPRGFLAAGLIEALGAPAADVDGDGHLSAGELFGFVADLTAFRAASFGLEQDPGRAGDTDLPVAPAAGR